MKGVSWVGMTTWKVLAWAGMTTWKVLVGQVWDNMRGVSWVSTGQHEGC